MLTLKNIVKTSCQGKDIKTTHVLNGYYHCATLTMMRDHVIYRPNIGTSRACLTQLVVIRGSAVRIRQQAWDYGKKLLSCGIFLPKYTWQRHAISAVEKNCRCDVVWMWIRLGRVMRDRAALISYIIVVT